ncbi:MAG: cytochrome c-type biogenesis protein CcmH [Acidobacteria bacterium]|nr:cytochrome c-type biogenesis protein CcmH [Acidobacteriota bacterium]
MTRPRIPAALRSLPWSLAIAVTLLAAGPALAQAPPSGDKEAAQAEAQVLFREVMSPFCPGLTLADCPSPNAFELRKDIQARLERGESREAIVDALVAQYGTELLSDPSDTPIGRVVWGVPFLLAALAAGVLAWLVRRMTRGQGAEMPGGAETPAVRERLDEELAALD